MKNRGRNRRKGKKVSVFHSQRIKFTAREVMAITVSEQSLRRAITRPSPKRRFTVQIFLQWHCELNCQRAAASEIPDSRFLQVVRDAGRKT